MMDYKILAVNLCLFTGNTNVTTDDGLSDEMKTYYSDYLIDLAEPELVHDQFGQKHPIPKNGGKTIEFRKYDSLPKALTPLTEGVTPNGQKLTMGTITATVAQYGGYIELSDVLLLTAIDNNLLQATRVLASQAGRTLDTITREVLNGGTNVQYAEGQVNSRAALAYTSESENHCMTVVAIRKAVRFLKLMNAPKISGGYVFAEDVPVRVISQVVDGHYAGVSTGTSSQRVYNTTYAAHILGRVSRIFAEDWDNYKDKGYSMDALVGKGGVEEAFESYLHGTNGVKLVTTDKNGKVTGELYAKEPQPGNTVALTIDLDLQKVTEDSLAEKIGSMEQRDGLTRGGAAAVVSVGTGEVLALASYPTYDLSQWDEMYDTWNKDTVGRPMFNRATDGTYAPGSTFKLCSAVAALESGIVTPSTTIVDRGIYTYYTFPQPKCWIYNSYGGTHGAVNVSQAITVSCNYFFYEVGRLMGIKTLDSYATQFGLGQHTGIEIGDSAGVLASPEYAEKIGETWTDGQTITAAIGQSYNLFTPLQLANYVATLVSGGDHYEAHLLKSAKSFDNSSVVYAYNKAPINHVDMADSTLEAVKKGARGLATGSLSYVFRNCVVDVGCKTGTAETSQKLTNGCFVAFAPYDDPQIAVAIVIEKGGSGSALASTAVEILNAYFTADESGAAIEGESTLLP